MITKVTSKVAVSKLVLGSKSDTTTDQFYLEHVTCESDPDLHKTTVDFLASYVKDFNCFSSNKTIFEKLFYCETNIKGKYLFLYKKIRNEQEVLQTRLLRLWHQFGGVQTVDSTGLDWTGLLG